MNEAWELIKQHPKVRVTLDCFWLGFVFFGASRKKSISKYGCKYVTSTATYVLIIKSRKLGVLNRKATYGQLDQD